MSINSNNFKLGSVVTALFVGSSNTPNYTYQGISVSDIGANTDYLVIQCLGASSGTQQIVLPSAAGNYVFVKNVTPSSVYCGLASNLNVTIVSGEIAALFFDGTQYNKVQIGTLNLNFNEYTNTSTLLGSSEFLVQTGSTINNITWSQLLSLLGLGTSTLLIAAACSTTNITLSGTQTVDGYSAPVGSLILANAQTVPSQNGLYVANSGAWVRSAAMAGGTGAANTCIAVKFGTQNQGLWINANTPGSDIVGTSALSWVTSSFVASNGVALTAGHNLVGTDYDYVINSLGTLRAATSEGSGSAATTVHLLNGSYLITGNTGIPSGASRVDISGMTLVVSAGVNVTLQGTTYQEGFINGSLVASAGSQVTLNDLTWVTNNSSNTIISTQSSNIQINNCVLAGGTVLVFNGGECFINDSQIGDGIFPNNSTQQIFVSVNTFDVAANPFQGELHIHGTRFYGNNSTSCNINLDTAPVYPLKKLDVQGCRFEYPQSYAIEINYDTQSVNIVNNTFIGSNQDIYFYSGTNILNTNVLIDGNTFDSTNIPIYFYTDLYPQSIICSNNVINKTNLIEGAGPTYDSDVFSTGANFGVLRMFDNYSRSFNSYLPNFMPANLAGGAGTITNSINTVDDLNADVVQKSIISAGSYAGVSHEIEAAYQNAGAVGNANAYVDGFIAQGSFSMQISIPAGITSVSFTPFKLDTTQNVYMGHVEIFMWTRVTSGGTAIPGWARVPFICSYNGGFSLLSTDATTLQIINNNAQKVAPATVGDTALIDKSEDYFWVGDTYHNAQGPAGKGMTSVVTDGLNATTNLLISGLSQSIISGVPTVTLAIPTCAVDRWLIMHFTYTAIQSDAGE